MHAHFVDDSAVLRTLYKILLRQIGAAAQLWTRISDTQAILVPHYSLFFMSSQLFGTAKLQ